MILRRIYDVSPTIFRRFPNQDSSSTRPRATLKIERTSANQQDSLRNQIPSTDLFHRSLPQSPSTEPFHRSLPQSSTDFGNRQPQPATICHFQPNSSEDPEPMARKCRESRFAISSNFVVRGFPQPSRMQTLKKKKRSAFWKKYCTMSQKLIKNWLTNIAMKYRKRISQRKMTRTTDENYCFCQRWGSEWWRPRELCAFSCVFSCVFPFSIQNFRTQGRKFSKSLENAWKFFRGKSTMSLQRKRRNEFSQMQW